MINIILIDFNIQGTLPLKTILEQRTKEEWRVFSQKSNHLHAGIIAKFLRFFWYFIFPLKIVLCRKRYKQIIGWQQFYGLNFAFWCRLFHLKKTNDLTVMTFIYKRKSGVAGLLYHKYMNYIVTSKYIDHFICFAKEECQYYADLFGIDKQKFVYVPLGMSMSKYNGEEDDGYIFATGRSNRDYDFLINSLVGTDFKCMIACDTYKRKVCYKNITVLNDCYGDNMQAMMAKCHCVVIPLKNLKMSSGQLVVIQAMSLGKPVICTNSDGIKDYVVDGVTGFLIENQQNQLLSALNKLYDQVETYNRMSVNSLASYKNKFTEDAMYNRIADIVNG